MTGHFCRRYSAITRLTAFPGGFDGRVAHGDAALPAGYRGHHRPRGHLTGAHGGAGSCEANVGRSGANEVGVNGSQARTRGTHLDELLTRGLDTPAFSRHSTDVIGGGREPAQLPEPSWTR